MSILKKITVDEKVALLKDLNRGSNSKGGNWGGQDNDKIGSPSQTQKFNHSQNDPIIIRGQQNVAITHPVIRNIREHKASH